MAALRRCSECGVSLKDKQAGAKTCSPEHRAKRSRRLRAQRKESATFAASLPDHLKHVADIVQHDSPEIAHELTAQELAPIVREAITEDVVRSIDTMVGLLPEAAAAIAEDIRGNDLTIRQRAYTQLLKYTVGHPAIISPEDKDAGNQLLVNFNLPRPGDNVAGVEAATELVETEIRQCDKCGQDKPITEFVAGSHRCATCYDEARALAAAMM